MQVGLCAAATITAWAVGCGGGSSGPPPGTVGNVVLRDANNYTSMSTLMLPKVQTLPGADLKICWGGVAKDILCHSLTPTTDIDNVSFLQIPNLTEQEIEKKLAAGQLPASQIKVYRDFHTDHQSTCTTLSAMTFGGTALVPEQDYAAATDLKYMLLFSKGTIPGSGARTMTFLEPTASSTSAAIEAPDGCNSKILAFTADITSPQPVSAPKAGPWVVDWSQLTRDGIGNEVIFQKLDSVIVGFYQGMTVAQLQTSFLNIELIATSLYRGPIPAGQKYLDLATTKDAGGASFTGFTSVDGVWAVAVMCGSCQVPAPIALAILKPTP
jgi:hypothetical protein